jgi:hypothetical protein
MESSTVGTHEVTGITRDPLLDLKGEKGGQGIESKLGRSLAASFSRFNDDESLDAKQAPPLSSFELGKALSTSAVVSGQGKKGAKDEKGEKGEEEQVGQDRQDQESLDAKQVPRGKASSKSAVIPELLTMTSYDSETEQDSHPNAEEKQESHPNGGEEKLTASVSALFEAVDADKSGFIELGELRALFKFAKLQEEMPAETAIGEMDTDSDGRVSLSELLSFCQANPKIGNRLIQTLNEPAQRKKENDAHKNLMKTFSPMPPSMQCELELQGTKKKSAPPPKKTMQRQVSAGAISITVQQMSKASFRKQVQITMIDGTEFVLPGKWTEKDKLLKVKASIEQERGVRAEAQKLYSGEDYNNYLPESTLLGSIEMWTFCMIVDEEGAEEDLAKTAEARRLALERARARHEMMLTAATKPLKLICMLIVAVITFGLYFGVSLASIIIAGEYRLDPCEKDLAWPLLLTGAFGILQSCLRIYVQHINQGRAEEEYEMRKKRVLINATCYTFLPCHSIRTYSIYDLCIRTDSIYDLCIASTNTKHLF